MTIKRIDRATIGELKLLAVAALQEQMNDLGLTVKAAKATYSYEYGSVTLEFGVKNEDGTVGGRDAEIFRVNCDMYGLAPSDMGRTFIDGSEKYEITGLKTRSQRCPITVKRVRDGKGFKYPAGRILQAFRLEELQKAEDERQAKSAKKHDAFCSVAEGRSETCICG